MEKNEALVLAAAIIAVGLIFGGTKIYNNNTNEQSQEQGLPAPAASGNIFSTVGSLVGQALGSFF